MRKEKFEYLLKFDTASWALWSERFMNNEGPEADVKNDYNAIARYLRKKLDEMKANIVLLGLNRSYNEKIEKKKDEKEYPLCANFHGIGHKGDRLLSEVIRPLNNLNGAFMTDLSTDLESNSNNVTINQEDVFQLFNKQLNILDSKIIHIICFGTKTFNSLKSITNAVTEEIPDSQGVLRCEIHQANRILICYKVIHYSYASRWRKNERFRHQMKIVNNQIGNYDN